MEEVRDVEGDGRIDVWASECVLMEDGSIWGPAWQDVCELG